MQANLDFQLDFAAVEAGRWKEAAFETLSEKGYEAFLSQKKMQTSSSVERDEPFQHLKAVESPKCGMVEETINHDSDGLDGVIRTSSEEETDSGEKNRWQLRVPPRGRARASTDEGKALRSSPLPGSQRARRGAAGKNRRPGSRARSPGSINAGLSSLLAARLAGKSLDELSDHQLLVK